MIPVYREVLVGCETPATSTAAVGVSTAATTASVVPCFSRSQESRPGLREIYANIFQDGRYVLHGSPDIAIVSGGSVQIPYQNTVLRTRAPKADALHIADTGQVAAIETLSRV